MDKIFVDSCCWIALYKGEKKAEEIAGELERAGSILTGSLNLLEVAYRMEEACGTRVARTIAATIAQKTELSDFSISILDDALNLRRKHSLATVDAVTLALAMQSGSTLLTLDRDYEGIPGVQLLK